MRGFDVDYSTPGVTPAVSSEMSRPYFEREMRLGCRVIFQWDQIKRFGEMCLDCAEIGHGSTMIEGFIFVDESRAAAFDLDFILPSSSASENEETMTRFDSWGEAVEWVFRL